MGHVQSEDGAGRSTHEASGPSPPSAERRPGEGLSQHSRSSRGSCRRKAGFRALLRGGDPGPDPGSMWCVPNGHIHSQGHGVYVAQGIENVIDWCRAAGLDGSEFEEVTGSVVVRLRAPVTDVTPEVTPEVTRLLPILVTPMSRNELQRALDLKDEEHLRTSQLLPALERGLIERTIPDKPASRLQQYRLTDRGQEWLREWGKEASQ